MVLSSLVLAIEDSPAEAHLLRSQLDATGGFQVECADSLTTGLKRVERGGIDVVVLDLDLPDSYGLETFKRLYSRAADIPIVVSTSTDEMSIAAEAVRLGAQDYLIKGTLGNDLLVRSLRYAMERHRLLIELQIEHQRERERHERQLQLLEHSIRSPRISATAVMLGQQALQERIRAAYNEFVKQYAELLELAMQQRKFKVDHDLSSELTAMAERLGSLNSMPRDVVDLHGDALQIKSIDALPQKLAAYREEAQFMLIELMGHLCSYYRSHGTGILAGFAPNQDPHADGENPARI
jgi:DNA-binding response OmpR family regulator